MPHSPLFEEYQRVKGSCYLGQTICTTPLSRQESEHPVPKHEFTKQSGRTTVYRVRGEMGLSLSLI